MMRCLVTGAAGFSGRHLAAMLTAAGHEVVGTGRATGAPGPWRRWLRADLTDGERVRSLLADAEPDVVFHLAGLLRGSDDELMVHNVRPVEHLCHALGKHGAPVRLVLAGSSAEYGPHSLDAPPFDEASPCAPVQPYGRSKLAASQHALRCASKDGIDVRIARPTNLLGPGLSPTLVAGSLVAQLADCLASGAPFAVRVGELTAQRDFLDVEDACRGYVALAKYQGPDRVFNFGADECFPIRTLVDILQHEVGAPIAVHRDPELLRGSTADRVAVSSAAATKALAFRRHVSLRESIARMWQAAVDNLPTELAS